MRARTHTCQEPGPADFAAVTGRVHKQLQQRDLMGVTFQFGHECILECARRFHTSFLELESDGSLDLPEFYLCDDAGQLAAVSTMVFADIPSIRSRCEGSFVRETGLKFCRRFDVEDYDIVPSLVKLTSLRKLSSMVREQLVITTSIRVEVDDNPLKVSLESFIASAEFSGGMKAIIGASSISHDIDVQVPHADRVADVVAGLKFTYVADELTTALFLREESKLLEGSEKKLHAAYNEADGAILISTRSVVHLGGGKEDVVEHLAAAMMSAMPDLEWFLGHKRAAFTSVLRCIFSDGPAAIASTLAQHEIEMNPSSSAQALGPGDVLPLTLVGGLVQSMDATFHEGEYVAVLVDGHYVIARVAAWPVNEQVVGRNLSREYKVQLSDNELKTLRHFELYKIIPDKVAASSNLIQEASAICSTNGPASHAPADDIDAASERKKLKQTLREMGQMAPADYKAAMRRLFLRWHPDKAGDTPLANFMFRIIRRHHEWYQRKLSGAREDDSWLDELDSESLNEATSVEPDSEVPRAETAYNPSPSQQQSWFEEFQEEMEQEARQQSHFQATAAHRVCFVPRSPQQWAPPRIIDKHQARDWLQQAECEELAARKLAESSPAGRALPAASVWHCAQVAEMALKSAALGTCGLTPGEFTGPAAHDICGLASRLSSAHPVTAEQRRGQQLPFPAGDLAWLQQAYLAARYPNASRGQIP
ncbi:unnamed protein product, partial [Polarella glacialis]